MALPLEIVIKAKDLASTALKDVREETGKLSGGMQAAGASAMKTGGVITAGVTMPLIAGAAKMVTVAGDYESQMNTLTLAATGNAESLGSLVDTAKAMGVELGANAGHTKKVAAAMKILVDAASKTGADTSLVGISAAESALALEDFYKNGLTTAEIFGGANGLNAYLNEGAKLSGVLRATIDLQAGSELNLADASGTVSTALKTFQLDAGQATAIADSFVQTADASATSVSALAAAHQSIGPTAAGFGLSLEDVNQALAIMSQQGLEGAEAGTALKSMLLQMLAPSGAVLDRFNKLGFSAYDLTNGQMKPLAQTIGEISGLLEVGADAADVYIGLNKAQYEELALYIMEYEDAAAAVAKLTEAKEAGTTLTADQVKEEAQYRDTLARTEKHIQAATFSQVEFNDGVVEAGKVTERYAIAAKKQMGGSYGINALSAFLVEGEGAFTSMADATAVAASAEEVAEKRTEGFQGSMEALMGTVETFMIRAGTPLIEMLTKIVEGITPIIEKIALADPEFIKIGVTIAVVVAAIPPLTVALGGLATAFGVLIGPAGVVLLVVAAIGGLVTLFVKEQGGLGPALETVKTKVTEFKDALVGLPAQITTLGTSIKTGLSDFFAQSSEDKMADVGAMAASVGQGLGDAVSSGADWLVQNVGPYATKLWEGLKAIVAAAFAKLTGGEGGEEGASTAGGNIGVVIGKIMGIGPKLIASTAAILFMGLKAVVEAAIKLITETDWATLMADIGTLIKNIFSGGTEDEAKKTEVGNLILAFFTGAMDGFITGLTGSLTWKTDIETWLTNNITKPFGDINLTEIGTNMITGLADGIKARADTYLKEKAEGVANLLPGWVKKVLGIESPSKVFAEIGSQTMAGLGEGVTQGVPGVLSPIQDATGQMQAGGASMAGGIGLGWGSQLGAVMGAMTQGIDAILMKIRAWATDIDTAQGMKKVTDLFQDLTDAFKNMAMLGQRLGATPDFGMLDEWILQYKDLARRTVGAIAEVTEELGYDNIKDFRKTGRRIHEAIGWVFEDLGMLTKDIVWPEDLDGFFWRFKETIRRVMGSIMEIASEVDSEHEVWKEFKRFALIGEQIGAMMQILGISFDFELPDREDLAGDVTKFVDALKTVTDKLSGWLSGLGLIKRGEYALAAEVAPLVTTIASLASIDLEIETGGESWATKFATWLERTKYAVGQIVPMLQGMHAKWGQADDDAKSILETVAGTGGHVSTLLGFLGTTLAVEAPEKGFAGALKLFLTGVEGAVGLIVPMLQRIHGAWGKAEEGAKSILETLAGTAGHVTSLLGVLGQSLKVESPEAGYLGMLRSYLGWVEVAVGAVVPMLERIHSAYGKAEEGAKSVLETVGGTAGHVTSLLGILGTSLKIEVPEGAFKADLSKMMGFIEYAAGKAIELVAKIRKKWDPDGTAEDTVLGAMSQASQDIQGVLGILGVDFWKGGEGLGFADSAGALEDEMNWLLDDIKYAMDLLMDPNDDRSLISMHDKFGDALTIAKSTAELIKGVFDALAGAVKSGSEALATGLDVTALTSLMSKFSQVAAAAQAMVPAAAPAMAYAGPSGAMGAPTIMPVGPRGAAGGPTASAQDLNITLEVTMYSEQLGEYLTLTDGHATAQNKAGEQVNIQLRPSANGKSV